MTYSAGALIEAVDYNGFVSTTAGANINATWSTGTSSAGYGQTALGTVSAGTFVTATQWATLVNTIASMANHQPTTITARSAPTAGTLISILNAVSTDISNCYTNRANAYAVGTQYIGWTGTNSKTTATAAGAWTLTFTNTVTFASANAARYFFNAGGLINIQTSKNALGATGDPEWNNLASTLCGQIRFSGIGTAHTIAGTSYAGTTKIGGTGTPTILSSATGYFALGAGAAATIIYKQFSATAPYTSNYIQTSVALDASSTILTFTTVWSNPEGDPISGGTTASGSTPGTAPCTICTYFPPESVYLTNTWGTPSVASTVA